MLNKGPGSGETTEKCEPDKKWHRKMETGSSWKIGISLRRWARVLMASEYARNPISPISGDYLAENVLRLIC